MKPDAKTAISILGKLLETSEAASLAYWTAPNVILTLSGARAYCDGVYWEDGRKGLLAKWDNDIKGSLGVLRHHWPLTVLDVGVKEARPGEKYASFELISEAGLRQVVAQTKLLDDNILEALLGQKSLENLFKVVERELRGHDKLQDYDDENINHIAFGLLLGYPDEAILGSVLSWQVDDPFAEPLLDADIRGAWYYICPKPVYSYPRRLVSDPVIIEHERLWSKILRDYYTSDFHRSLEPNVEFQQKLKELRSLR